METEAWIAEATGARRVERLERVQSLWSGYGEVVRYRLDGARLDGAELPSVILKRVEPPASAGLSHERKLRSYEVERRWYSGLAARCLEPARVPRGLAAERTRAGWRFLLEDLDAAGFGERRGSLGPAETELCLEWLAYFHATFLGERPEGLWESGTYWHLATRPEELAELRDAELIAAARAIDARLEACVHRTLVHGDAKPANFCFRPDGSAVAAVDFQYVGGGCGVKDLAYLLFARRGWGAGEAETSRHLDAYFGYLRAAIEELGRPTDAEALEEEWRALFPLARADFRRFLAGWSPSRGTLRELREALTPSLRGALDLS